MENKRPFNAVKFIQLPFEGIDDYVCVPDCWIISRKSMDQNVLVAYPKDEDPFVTRDRAKRREKYDKNWGFYLASIKYESDTYKDAEFWIATRNDNGPFAHKDSKLGDTKPGPSNTQLSIHQHCESERSMPEIDMDAATEDIIVITDEEDQSLLRQKESARQSKETNSNYQTNYSRNTTAASMIASKPSTTDDQTAQPYQHTGQPPLLSSVNLSLNSPPQEGVVRSSRMINDDQRARISHHNSNLLKLSDLLHHYAMNKPQLLAVKNPVNKKIRLENVMRNIATAAQTSSRSIKNKKTLSTCSFERKSPIVTQKQSQNVLQVPINNAKSSIAENRINESSLLRGNSNSSQENQYVSKRQVEISYDSNTVDQKLLRQDTSNSTPALQNSSNLPHYPRSCVQLIQSQHSSLAQEYLQRLARKQESLNGSQTTDREESVENLKNKSFATRHWPDSAASQQGKNLLHCRDNQYLPVNQDNLQQKRHELEQLKMPTKSNYSDYRLKDQPMRVKEYFTNQSDQNIDLPQQHSNHKNLPRDPSLQKIYEMCSFEMPSCSFNQSQEIKRPSIPVQNNGYQNTRIQKRVVDQSIETNLPMKRVCFQDNIVRSIDTERTSQLVDSACKSEGSIIKEPLLQFHEIPIDKEPVTDHYEDSDYDMSTNNTPDEIDRIQIPCESNSADRPIIPQSPTTTSIHMHPRIILEQQMLNEFATLFTQMGTTLAYTCDMFNNLRSSILESADTYKTILHTVDKFNTLGNSVSTSSSSSNVTSDVPQATTTDDKTNDDDKERRTGVPEEETSGNGSRCNINVVKEPPKKKHYIRWTFALPPEYDPNDTKWTLKYRENMPGLVELMPDSDIYVSYGELHYCTRASRNMKELAELLLIEVFNKSALSVCESLTERAKASHKDGINRRPPLDANACIVLLKFIQKYAHQNGWDTQDGADVLKVMHNKMLHMRFTYGRSVRC